MSNIILDGFATYNTGKMVNNNVKANMLAGAWAEVPNYAGSTGAAARITTLPWDTTNNDLYIATKRADTAAESGWRRVLPTALPTVITSFYYAVAELSSDDSHRVCSWRNGANNEICRLVVSTTGSMSVYAGGTKASTSGPVIVAETAAHVEVKLTPASGTFKLYVDGEIVINATGLALNNTDSVAQISFLPMATGFSGNFNTYHYVGHLIIRDTNGTRNNDITGDRKVATLFPNADDLSHQGWTPRPLHTFGVGILDLSASSSAVRAAKSTDTDIGSNDFTLEGMFRFQTLPTGSSKMVLFGKWDEANDERSYQLYIGGPSLESGYTVFRTSTDGQNGTVSEPLKVKWEPVVGITYHVAMCRDSGNLKLFINGVQYGQNVADGATYHAANAYPCLGAQLAGTSMVSGTRFDGWQDEFRFTKGLSRYSANFAKPTAAFPRSGDDTNWGAVVWLSSWDNAVVDDDGPLNLTLVSMGGAAAITPDDGEFAFQTINKNIPDDDTFIEAALLPAEGTLTFTGQPANTETVTVGTSDGSTAAVYTFKTAISAAFDVLIGASTADSISNLVAAINGGTGAGTVYGNSTIANADVSAEALPGSQMKVSASIPGTSGNSIASTETVANASWGAATLAGGQDIPSYSQFSFDRLPSNTVTVDSITYASRQWKTDAGSATTKLSFVGGGGAKTDADPHNLSVTPSLLFDTFELDPDTSGAITPTTVLNSKLRIDRTV